MRVGQWQSNRPSKVPQGLEANLEYFSSGDIQFGFSEKVSLGPESY